jgi:hypothetical protein
LWLGEGVSDAFELLQRPIFMKNYNPSFILCLSLSGRNRQIWRFQDPISSKILNRYSTPLSLRLTLLHVCTNPRPFDCAITRVNRQRTSPSTQRF